MQSAEAKPNSLEYLFADELQLLRRLLIFNFNDLFHDSLYKF